ncbi:MAG: URC4/urg3 family protein [Pseudomonadota bacterium]|nr:URC4/urg3 family protein [Pseudomonadota bacterium]
MSPDQTLAQAITWLRTPAAIRARCHALLSLAERDALPHFALDLSRLGPAAAFVADVTRRNYPDLAIPIHSRWRHFETGGIDRWRLMAAGLRQYDRAEIARARIDLCVVSVLLDAGAGAAWRYRESDSGLILARSEGLAVASVHAFRAGLFSSDPARPLQVDANGLAALTETALAQAFQVTRENPLAALPGRVALMRNLGAALRSIPLREGALGSGNTNTRRPALLLDRLRAQAVAGRLPAASILEAVLTALAPIWPERLRLGGENLGDVWHHSLVGGKAPTAGLVPFHKLAQWLSYSLVEVMGDCGLAISDLDGLTGLAEYRNGGLFLDAGVLRLRNPSLAENPLPVAHPAIVEWRALTVALLDRLAAPVRACLGPSAAELPLASILQGGTWAAGRELAQRLRPDAAPPLRTLSDGTVF